MNDTAEATGHPAPDEQDPAPEPVAVHGTVAPGYEPVRDAFARYFAQLGDRGAAVTVHRHGTPRVGQWGGPRAPASPPPARFFVDQPISASRSLTILSHVLAGSAPLMICT